MGRDTSTGIPERRSLERRRTDEALLQSNRALRLFSQCNSAVVHATDEKALLDQICRIAVHSAGYRMAWVGRAEDDARKTVRPVTFAGPGEGFLDAIHVSWANDEYGQGTAGVAIRTRKPAIARDLLTNPSFAAWRSVFVTRDFAAAIAVPLVVDDQVYGVLVVYACEPDAFDSTEVGLLEELGANIAQGMTLIRTRRERGEAIAALEQARDHLEQRIEERTLELRAKNAELLGEIELRKKVEGILQQSRENYRELIENSNSIILRMDAAGRITFFNEFAQRFFGFEWDEVLGRDIVGTLLPETDSAGRDMRKMVHDIAVNPPGYARNENENVRKNGERVWIAWANKPVFDPSGKLVETLCIGNDITDHKRAEEELQRAKEAAETADRIKSAFLATMSHELRTPLNSIIGFTGILLQKLAGPLNDEQSKQLGMVQTSARHLLALINDVLDISKIEAGQLQVSFGRLEVEPIVARARETVAPLADRKGLALHSAVEPGLAAMGDQRRVEQVLINLLSNAVKFTEAGSVRVSCARRGERVEIAVADSGIGIAPEHVDSLFRPFHQIDSGLSRKHEGTGLGLSICKRLLELMGGSIRVESTPGVGSIFTAALPAPGADS